MPPAMRHDLAPVLTYIQDHLSEPFTMRELAHRMHLSQTTLRVRFKAATGQTPHHFLVAARMARAAECLRASTETIGAIAGACGYPDHSHFTQEFKRVVGVTPWEYRHQAAMQHTFDTLPLVCALWPKVGPEVQRAVLAQLQAAVEADPRGVP